MQRYAHMYLNFENTVSGIIVQMIVEMRTPIARF
jgi:hypothetical protein